MKTLTQFLLESSRNIKKFVDLNVNDEIYTVYMDDRKRECYVHTNHVKSVSQEKSLDNQMMHVIHTDISGASDVCLFPEALNASAKYVDAMEKSSLYSVICADINIVNDLMERHKNNPRKKVIIPQSVQQLKYEMLYLEDM